MKNHRGGEIGVITGRRRPLERPAAPVLDNAATDRRSEHEHTELRTRCWCNSRNVDVPAAMVRALQTISCGRPKCTKGTPIK